MGRIHAVSSRDEEKGLEMGMRKLGIMAMVALLSACNQQAANNQAENAAGPATATTESKDYLISLPLNEFMPHVMQYSAEGIWKHQGYTVDAQGEHSLFPKNDEEWEEAESGARTLAEVTNLLLLPGRRVDDGDWTKAAIEVRKIALKAADAAEKKDPDAFFDAGGELDEACDVCHKEYDPSFKTQGK